MRVDIHVHTSEYSDCGVDSPAEMVQAAMDFGLDALVFAEHNYMWRPKELKELQHRYPKVKLFSGIEVSIDSEEHIVVIGVTDPNLFFPFMSPAEVIAAAGHQGGVAILAHPFRWSPTVRQDILDAGFDAIEIYSNSIRNYMQAPIRDLHRQLNLPLVASSDGHHTQGLGHYAIDLQRPAQDEKDLAQLIRQGQFSIWSNPQRIDGLNADMTNRVAKLPELLAGTSGIKEALCQVGLSKNLAYAVSNNLDILYPKGVEI